MRFKMCRKCTLNVHCGSCDCCPRRPAPEEYKQVAAGACYFLLTTKPTDRALEGWRPNI